MKRVERRWRKKSRLWWKKVKLKGVMEHIRSSIFLFSIDFSALDSESTDVASNYTIVATHTDLESDLPWFSFSFHESHIITFSFLTIIVILDWRMLFCDTDTMFWLCTLWQVSVTYFMVSLWFLYTIVILIILFKLHYLW